MGRLSKLWKRARVGKLIVAEPLLDDGEGFEIARVVRLGVGLLAPEVGLHHPAAADTDLQAPVAEVIEHADLFDQPQWMVQGQHVDARAET
jgi:hypothetical protein